jgi:zinc transporter, ZIP family
LETRADSKSDGWSRAAAALLIIASLGLVAATGLIWPELRPHLDELDALQLGVLASFVAGLFTAVGALPIFFVRRLSGTLEDSLMGFGAGVMLAATAFELVMPAVAGAEQLFDRPSVTIAMLAFGIGLGGLVLFVLHRLVPHEHFVGGPESCADPAKIRRVWLFILAIALHNLPEGLAVGVGFGGENVADGVALAIGIGLQNMPEGLIVAVAMISLGYGRWTAFGVTLLTGLVQPLGGLVGAAAVSVFSVLLPIALAFAAGAMLFVISHEIIPESHRKDHKSNATFGVLLGFVVMVAIDVALE